MPRIKELEDILTLVDELPPERQMDCVWWLFTQVASWEDQQSLGPNAGVCQGVDQAAGVSNVWRKR